MNNLEFITALAGPEGQRLLRLRDANRCCATAHAQQYSLITGLAGELIDLIDLNGTRPDQAFATGQLSTASLIARAVAAALQSGRWLPIGITSFPEGTPLDPPEYLMEWAKEGWIRATQICQLALPYVEPESQPAPAPMPVQGQVGVAKKVLRCMEGNLLSQGSPRQWATLKKGGDTVKYTYVRTLEK